jgi:short-subunit dehydrogenase
VQPADLSSPDDLKSLADRIAAEHERIDILIHSAALHATGSVADTSVELLESQHRTNVAAPYALTRAWLPQLQRARGQVVFLNSSAGIAAHANLSQYAATKHALKAIADSLREEVNASQVRVLSVFAGRTATPLQERLFAAEGREYQPERLLQPSDVARMVLAALALPRTAEVTEIHIRPLQKPAPREEVL